MTIPVVIITGRPNVGKSSLFNCLAGQRISIVDPTCGVTRDRISIQIDHNGKQFELFDTGGIGINDVDNLDHEINEQIEIAINKSDLILFVVDVRDGITPLDSEIADKFRKINKPILLVVNKVDSKQHELLVSEFFKIGLGTPFPISAIAKYGRQDLLDNITTFLPLNGHYEESNEPLMKLAIVGRRNVGKSTLINTLAKEERVIVSEVPGTTRDSVDVKFDLNGKQFLAIDTAGLRKKSSMNDAVEFYSKIRTERAIKRADVVLVLLDVVEGVSDVDKKLGGFIRKQVKPCIIVCNKWDLVKNIVPGEFEKYIGSVLPGLSYAPISFISALNRENVVKTIKLAQDLYEQADSRVSTSELNIFIKHAMSTHTPCRRKSKVPKIYYGTQVSVRPPTFVLFVNDKSLFDSDYERFLGNQLRNNFNFPEIPVRIYFRPKVKDESGKYTN